MSVLKCKMCAGNLEIEKGENIATCPYCGTKQTIPDIRNEGFVNTYNRVNTYRQAKEYDKAINLCEQVLNNEEANAENYWQRLLCRYGIEYVEDPKTKKRVPTINRMQYTSILKDKDYLNVLNYADKEQKTVYEEQAKAISEIQNKILKLIKSEKPFDVFICYKETDEDGKRTQDSVLANDLYYQLTDAGLKVFFSKITLEGKLGTEYEPYIFSALNTAKVMVVLGTKKEYFESVWVKNEWSRFLALTKEDPQKLLIPAYKDMDAYDLPEEFSHFQAQDMSKIGFVQDLVRGVKKVKTSKKKKTLPIIAAVAAGLLIVVAAGFFLTQNYHKKQIIDSADKEDIVVGAVIDTKEIIDDSNGNNDNKSTEQEDKIDSNQSAKSDDNNGQITTSGSEEIKDDEPQIVEIILNTDGCSLIENHYADIKATVLPSDADVNTLVWTSNAPDVVEIRNGNQVFAKGAGNAKVIVSTPDGLINKTLKCEVWEEQDGRPADKDYWYIRVNGVGVSGASQEWLLSNYGRCYEFEGEFFSDIRMHSYIPLIIKTSYLQKFYTFTTFSSNTELFQKLYISGPSKDSIDIINDLSLKQEFQEFIYLNFNLNLSNLEAAIASGETSVTIGFEAKYKGTMNKDVKPISQSITFDLQELMEYFEV